MKRSRFTSGDSASFEIQIPVVPVPTDSGGAGHCRDWGAFARLIVSFQERIRTELAKHVLLAIEIVSLRRRPRDLGQDA